MKTDRTSGEKKMLKRLIWIAVMILAIDTSLKAQKADSLRMDSIIHSLPEVMVKGERPTVKVVQGKLVYDVQKLVEKKAVDNIYDALKEIPGVTEQEKSLTLGGMPATVVLDGKVTTMTSEQLMTLLKTLPASRINKVEVMYSAPARMQVHGAFINVLLKHSAGKDTPLSGELNTSWDQDHDANFGERAALLYERGKFSMDIMYKHSHGDDYSTKDETSLHTLNDGTVHDITTHEVDQYNSFGHEYRIGMDYTFSKDHQFSFVYTGNYDKDRSHQNITESVKGTTQINEHTWLHNLRLDYHTPFGLKAGVEMTCYHNPEMQYLNSTLPTGSLNYTVDNDQKINRWKFFLSQEQKLKEGWSINYGAVYTTSIDNSRQYYMEMKQSAGDDPMSSSTRKHEDDASLYFGFNKDFGTKLMLESSLSGEYYHTSVWHQWYVYPVFTLTWLPATGHVFQLGMSSNRTYPDYWTMTNFITYDNGGYNEITGNPYLKPSSKYQLQLVYVLKDKYQFVAWFAHTKDKFTQTPYQRHDRLAINYQYLNLNFQQQAGLQAAIPFKAGSWLDTHFTLSGVWMRQKDDDFYDIPYDRNIAFVMAEINNTLTLATKPDITMSVDGMIRSKAIQATYDLPASGNLDLSARWQFWNKHAILKFFCNDLFETSSINPRIDFKGQNLRMDFSCYREFGISFTYKFRGYKDKKRATVDTSRFKTQ
jgi:hypothetical protein